MTEKRRLEFIKRYNIDDNKFYESIIEEDGGSSTRKCTTCGQSHSFKPNFDGVKTIFDIFARRRSSSTTREVDNAS